jgi:hypothetical protein
VALEFLSDTVAADAQALGRFLRGARAPRRVGPEPPRAYVLIVTSRYASVQISFQSPLLCTPLITAAI